MESPDRTLEAVVAELERAADRSDARRKTWDDLERRALECPVLYHAVRMVNRSILSREDALVAVAIYLSEERARFLDDEVRRRAMTTADFPVYPDAGGQ